MSRGKPLCVGPTARLPQGVTWETLAATAPKEIRRAGTFPYLVAPTPQANPRRTGLSQLQIAMFPRLERFDVDFDLPDAFLPEFPPAIFLQSRPELGDVFAVKSSRSTTFIASSRKSSLPFSWTD